MGLFESECRHCKSKEHASEDCPHGFFSGNKCTNCGSVEHASEDCPHGFFSGNKCSNCGSVEHASEDCPHGFFSGNKCSNCGSVEHASEDCPHGFFSGNKCSNCGSIEHSSDDCPQGLFATRSAESTTSYSSSSASSSSSSDDGCVTAIIWIGVVIGVIAVVVWLAVNVVLPVLLLNSALILTIAAFAVKKFRVLFASLAIFGVAYMILDIESEWFSRNFVENVVQDPVWITSFVYINSLAVAISIGILVLPLWNLGKGLIPTEKPKGLLISGAAVLLVVLGGMIPPMIYNGVFESFGANAKSPPTSNVVVKNEPIKAVETARPARTNVSSKPINTKTIESYDVGEGELAVISDADGFTNLRSGKGTDFPVVKQIHSYEQLRVFPSEEKWWAVKTKDGKRGFMFHDRIDLLSRKYYVINIAAVKTETQALKEVKNLKNQGYNAGHLWIPNYRSLSGAKFYSVYVGPFKSQSECETETERVRKTFLTAYGLLVSQDNKRVEIRGKGKVKVTNNGVNGKTAVINGTDVIIRSGHSTSSKIIGSFKYTGEKVHILDVHHTNDGTALLLKPVKVRIGSEIVQLEKGKAVTILSKGSEKVKVRFKDRSLKDQVVSIGANSVEVVSESTWYKIKRGNGETGWVFGRFVTLN